MRHGRDRVSENSATWHSPLLGGSAVKLSVTDRSHYDAVISHPKLTERKPMFNIAHSQRFNGE